MRKRFWKIAVAATASVLALTSVTASSIAEIADKSAKDNVVVIAEKSAVNESGYTVADNGGIVLTDEDIAEYQKYYEVYKEAYERALQEELSKVNHEEFYDKMAAGEYPNDPNIVARERAQARAEEECRAKGRSIKSSSIKLTKREGFTAFDLYEGTFDVSQVDKQTFSFINPPYFFECTSGKEDGGSGIEGIMEVPSGYAGNYKNISVTITYSDGTVQTGRSHSNSSTCSVTIPKSAKTIEKASFNYYLYAGSDTTTKVLECAIVNLEREK